MINFSEVLKSKKEWRAHKRRVKRLPPDYQVVYQEIQKYLFNFSLGDAQDTIAGLYQLQEFLAEGARKGIPVLAYIGPDVGAFAEEYRKSLATRSWETDWDVKLRDKIKAKFDKQSEN